MSDVRCVAHGVRTAPGNPDEGQFQNLCEIVRRARKNRRIVGNVQVPQHTEQIVAHRVAGCAKTGWPIPRCLLNRVDAVLYLPLHFVRAPAREVVEMVERVVRDFVSSLGERAQPLRTFVTAEIGSDGK